jgi:hypothetical protein
VAIACLSAGRLAGVSAVASNSDVAVSENFDAATIAPSGNTSIPLPAAPARRFAGSLSIIEPESSSTKATPRLLGTTHEAAAWASGARAHRTIAAASSPTTRQATPLPCLCEMTPAGPPIPETSYAPVSGSSSMPADRRVRLRAVAQAAQTACMHVNGGSPGTGQSAAQGQARTDAMLAFARA